MLTEDRLRFCIDAGGGSGPALNASSPSNHGLMSVVYVWSSDVMPLTISSSASSSLLSSAAWSLNPGNFERNSPAAARWSPGRSRRSSP